MRAAIFTILLALAFASGPARADDPEPIATTSAGEVALVTPYDGPQRLLIGGRPVTMPGRPYRLYLDRQFGDQLLFMLGDPEDGWCRMLYAWVEATTATASDMFGSCAEIDEVIARADGSYRVVMAGGEPGAGYTAYDWSGGAVSETDLGLRPSGKGTGEGAEFWLDRYPYELTIAADYQPALLALMGPAKLERLQANISLNTPFERVGDWFVGEGCEKYACPDNAAMILLRAADELLVVGLRDAGETEVFASEKVPLPEAFHAFLDGRMLGD